MTAPIWILQPDAQGNCCDCSTSRIEPCDACAPSSGSCCSFGPFGAGIPLTGCYELYSISGIVSTAGAGSFATIVDSGPNDTFSLNNIILNRSISFSVGTSDPGGSFANAGSTMNWGIAISVSGNLTITTEGSIFGHDCPETSATIYPYNSQCGIDIFNPVATINFASDPCDVSIPFNFASSHTVNLMDGSYAIYFVFGVGFAFSQNTSFCYPASCNGSMDATVTIAGNFVPLPYQGNSASENPPISCNKMLIPLLTEVTHDWYGSLSAAQDDINHQVVNCFTYLDPNFGGTTLSNVSTALGSASFSEALWGGGYFVPWFSVNLIGGQSYTAQTSITSNMTNGCNPSNPLNCSIAKAQISVLDDTGTNNIAHNDISTDGAVTATISVSFTAPYTGKYIIRGLGLSNTWAINVGAWSANGSVTIIGGAVTNNSIQALYDVGLDCPGRLNCS